MHNRALLAPAHLAVLLATIAAFGIAQVLTLSANIDVAWFLYAGARVLDGAELYVDILEVNPPLVMFMSMGIESLARLTGVPSLTLYPIVVFAAVGVSLILCWRLSQTMPLAVRQVLIVGAAYLLLQHSGRVYGQREHLLLILILPYAFSAAATARGGRESDPVRERAARAALAAGVLAGVGFAFKPFFLPALAAVELYLARQRGPRIWLRPQAVAIGCVLLAYAAAVLIVTPHYLPFAREALSIYRAYQPYGDMLVSSSWRAVIVAIAIGLAWGRGREATPEWTVVAGLLASTLTLAVYAQGKGWSYHWHPATTLAGLLLTTAAAGWLLRSNAAAHTLRRGLTVVVCCACVLTYGIWSNASRPSPELERIVRVHGRDGGFAALSSYLGAGFPMVNRTGVRWALRHPTLWQIAGFYRPSEWRRGTYRSLQQMDAAERAFVDSVVTDLAGHHPGVLLVDRVPPTPAMAGFDYVTYFSSEPRFSKLFREYRAIGQVGRYRVFVRGDGNASGPADRSVKRTGRARGDERTCPSVHALAARPYAGAL